MIEQFIGVDWGSTNLRAWLFDGEHCVDSLRSELGVTRFNGQPAAAIFHQVFDNWLAQYPDGIPVVMAGMIGSNAGWVSTPYQMCPVNLSQISQHLMPVEQLAPMRGWIVPGIAINQADNCNVMRGEETQLIGAHACQPSDYYVMPGTHSKWVQMDGDNIADFRTVMTGELHHLLINHSLVGAGIGEQRECADAFKQGMEVGFNEANIIRRLFETRAAHVLGQLDRSVVQEWLSGLLIGHEVAQMQHQYADVKQRGITLIGSQKLVARYLQAMAFADIPHRTIDGDIAFKSGIRSLVNELEN
ncbi:2-dehydro-3-deoxygalactonokinase [Budvicia aquatica]|uniref:2-keto-3-deoxy-galactonokinase n=1 Tax=Budvicia aquatica TaxID=82979 RepID=A0A2C6DHK0_9GAMM|nr:2-dehydro-3-deoxygalactonokinase [Budvicia aquatica]PHI28291.1 2-oxo-3-deoxygalactonate kinase [Budvicia aquatica]VFS46181.1 2-keto-3-deoxy-galactonokinase [Budvicia aquatica]